jgi:hypothetical protein
LRVLLLAILALSIIIPIGISYALTVTNDGSVKSTVEINSSNDPGPTLTDEDHFGDSVANIGDLNGDGVNDLAVGAIKDDEGGTDRGAVHILFMNKDGSIESTEEINESTDNVPTLVNEDRFGDSVANIGDLNGDGVNDLAVGAPNDDTKPNGDGFAEHGNRNWDAGAIYILFMNSNGSVKETVKIDSETLDDIGDTAIGEGDSFGHGIANIGDLDNNGKNDIAVGAMLDDGIGSNRGAVHILFMADANDGSVESTVEINGSTTNGPTLANGYWFGGSVANIDDLNGDGVNDLAVGVNLDSDAGKHRGAVHIIFMNTDGSVVSTVEINDDTDNGPTLANNDRFGTGVANMGDLDGDGVNDLAVGARFDDIKSDGTDGGANWNAGAVHIMFMNKDGSVKSTVEINDSTANGPTLGMGDTFGTSMANIGDLDGNGINDLAVGARLDDEGGTDRGAVHILFMVAIEEKKGSPCWDCTRPAITHHGHSETPDGFSINDAIFENNQELYNENPTIEATVGDMVTIKARAWDNRGPENIVRVFTYLDMYEEKPNWHESEAYIEYNIKKDKFEVNDKNKIFALVGASSEVAVNPYRDDGKKPNRPLELLDITFTIIFAKPMETSHIAIQTIDDGRNYELVYFEDALEIKDKVIIQVPEEIPEEIPEEVPEEIPEEIPEVPEEVIPEPEPPIKEPEPEVMLTALIKKGVLNFVDEDVPAKHYVKRYITETEYREWFDVNYSEYQFWEGIGITEEKFDQITLEIQSEPKPKMIQTGFVFIPEDEKSFPLVEETYEPEPAELEPVKEKKGFFDWLFSLFG